MFVKSGGVEEEDEEEEDEEDSEGSQSQRLTPWVQDKTNPLKGRATTASTIVAGFNERGGAGDSSGTSSLSGFDGTASPIRTQRTAGFAHKAGAAAGPSRANGPTTPSPKGLVGVLATSARDGLRVTGDFMSGLDFQALFSTPRGRSGGEGVDGDDLDGSLPDDIDGSQVSNEEEEEEEEEEEIHRSTWRPTNLLSLQRKEATAKVAPEESLADTYRDPKEGRLRRRSIDRSAGDAEDDTR